MNKKNIILIVSSFVAVFMIYSVCILSFGKDKKFDSIDDLAKDYIKLMDSGIKADFSIDQDVIVIANDILQLESSINEERETSELILLEQAKPYLLKQKEKVKLEKRERIKKIKESRDYVTDKFAQDAWSNVKYFVEPATCPEKIEKCFLKDNGQEISSEECSKQYVAFWKDICSRERIDFDDFYDNIKNRSGMLSQEYIDLYIKYMNNIPVEIKLVDKYEAKFIKFSFNGKERFEDKYDFRIKVMNKAGDWVVIEDLSYSSDVPEPLFED